METLHLPIALCVVSRGPALLDTKGRAQLLYKGRREVCPPVIQQISGCSEDCYEVLIEHLHNCLGRLVFGYHSQSIPCEMVSHHKDILHHGGLIQLHHGLDAGVVKMHKLQQSIYLNRTEGSPWHLPLKCLAAWASPHYSSAIFSHHGPPEPLLCEGQGPLLSLMASVPVYSIKRHAANTPSVSPFRVMLTYIRPLFKTRLLQMWKKILPCSVSASAPRHSLRRVSCLDGGIPFLRRSHLRHATRAASTSWACSQSTTCISSSFAALTCASWLRCSCSSRSPSLASASPLLDAPTITPSSRD